MGAPAVRPRDRHRVPSAVLVLSLARPHTQPYPQAQSRPHLRTGRTAGTHTLTLTHREERERENINERPAQGAIGWWMVKSGLGMLHHVAYPPPSLFHYSCSILPRNSLERVCIRFLAEVDKDNQDIPRVSPYRLATHLSAALMLYSAMVCPLQHMLNASLKRSEK